MISERDTFYKSTFLLLVLLFCSATVVSAQKRKRPESQPTVSAKQREAEFYFTEGEKYFILEDYAKALTYYERALEANPESGTVHFKIAEVLSKSDRQEDLLKASSSIETALTLDQNNKFFYLTAAAIFNSLGKFEKAAETYEQLLSNIKGSEEYLYELAAVYQYANNPQEAIKTYDRVEKAFGVNEVSSVQKIRLYLETGKTKEAIVEGEKLVNAFPEEERYMMAFAEMLSQKGMRDQAIQYLEKFLSQNSLAGNAQMLLASFYREKNEEAKAQPLLLSVFDNPDVDISSKLIVLGTYNSELNDARMKGVRDTAKEAFATTLFEKLKSTDPSHPSLHIIGGDLFLAINRQKEAQKEYLLAVASGDASFEVWENLVFLEIQLEEYEAAVQHAEEALEVFPNQGMLHYFHGFANVRLQQHVAAIASLQMAKKLSTAKPALMSEINGMLGDAFFAKKDFEKSDAAYEEGLSQKADNTTILNNYSYHLAVRKAQLEKAEKMSSTLVRLQPENPMFLDTHALVLFAREKFKDARKVIEKAISTGKATATHFEHYGDILYKLGDVDGAVAQWEKAKGLNAKSETLMRKIANRKIYE